MNGLDNLSYFVITGMSIEFKPQSDPSENYDLLTVSVMDLNTLESFDILDKLPPHCAKTTTNIDGVLAKILFENGVDEYSMRYGYFLLDYNKDLIYEYCIDDPKYFFNAIKLKEDIRKWDDLIFIPCIERQKLRLLKEISTK